MHRRGFKTKNYSVQNDNSAKLEKFCYKWIRDPLKNYKSTIREHGCVLINNQTVEKIFPISMNCGNLPMKYTDIIKIEEYLYEFK